MASFLRKLKNIKLEDKKPKEIKLEDQKEDKDVRSPPVRTIDLGNGIVKVELLIPGLEPDLDRLNPKGGEIFLDIMNWAFSMKATLKDKKNKKVTKYRFKVKRLPGRINPNTSKWDVEKNKIVIWMEKHAEDRNIDWGHPVGMKGLDQTSSSDSGSDSSSNSSSNSNTF